MFSYEATLGYFALIPPGLRCCLGRRLALIRPKAKGGAPHFWFHQFTAAPFQRLLDKHQLQRHQCNDRERGLHQQNLHLLWDVRILQGTYTAPEQVVETITKRLRPMPDCGTPAQWANEGHQIVKTFVYPALGPPPAIRIQTIAIPDDYVAKALPIIEERLTLAAMRLSCVLNKALDPQK